MTDSHDVQRRMAARQPQGPCKAVIVERSDWDSRKSDGNGLEQHVLRGMARLELDVATATIPVLPGRSRVDGDNHERQRCSADGRLVKGGSGGFGTEVPVGEKLDAMALSDVMAIRARGE